MPLYKTEAVALRLTPSGDRDGIVALLTRQRGKVRAVAKGVRRAKSSLAAAVQPPCYSLVSLAEGTNLDILTQAVVHESFPEVRRDLRRMAATAFVLDLAGATSADGQANRPAFDLLLWTLFGLRGALEPVTAANVFAAQLCRLLGVPLQVGRCRTCGSQPANAFSVEVGATLCSRCAQGSTNVIPLRSEQAEALARYAMMCTDQGPPISLASEAPQPALLALLVGYLAQHLDVRVRSLEFLLQVAGRSIQQA